MKKLDSEGSKLCSYQAEIFEKSVKRFQCSSKIFLRRFFNSEFAFYLDIPLGRIFSFDTEECYLSMLEDFGDSTYGKIKLSAKVLHYLGYITRYICYTRSITSGHLYRLINIYDIADNYEIYHTQDEEWVIANILLKEHLEEKDLDEDEILKDLFRKYYKSKLDH